MDEIRHLLGVGNRGTYVLPTAEHPLLLATSIPGS